MDHIYEPLKTEDSFRLIKLLGRTQSGLVSCTLEQYEIKQAPAYRALSYYWGSPDPTDAISLGPQRMLKIHKNLWHFLDQMVFDEYLGYYWTDALCIDQKNLEERNHQVGYMGEIYRLASQVVMWLGRESRVQGSMERLFEHAAGKRPHTCCQQKDVADLLNIPYWNRLWVVQEVLLARSLLVVCGHSMLGKTEFATALDQCSANTHHYRQDPWPELRWDRSEQEDSGLGKPATVPQVLRLLNFARKKQPLWQLISEFSQGICSDARDKIFGLLGLRSLPHLRNTTAEKSPVVVDYNKGLLDLF